MTPPNEDRRRETGDGRRSLSIPVSVVLAALLVAAPLSIGCRRPPPTFAADEKQATKGDPWEAAVKRLRKDTDSATAKTALGTLTGDLARSEKAAKPPALSREAEDALTKLVPLNDQDRDELRVAAFTPYDPAYLADCLYLRDAARSLAVQGATPEQLADLGFAWVCRQVYLNPWTVEVQPGLRIGTALPPASVLRRGYGSGLERMYVFLALLQQMGLDGCLVGSPDAAGKPAGLVVYGPDKQTVLTGAPRGPFWAVGVRVGNDVRLYDPWRGTAFPAPLGPLKANPDAHNG